MLPAKDVLLLVVLILPNCCREGHSQGAFTTIEYALQGSDLFLFEKPD